MNWREFQRMQHIAEIDERRGRFVSYIDKGAGEGRETVVLLHGIPTWSYLWHEVIPALAETHRVLAPDLPGFGYSDKSDDFDRSVARQTDYVIAWLDRLGVERASFVGHDIGGGIALRLATLHEQRVERLAVMNAVCYDSFPVEAMLQLGHPGADRTLSAQAAGALLRQVLKGGFAASPPGDLLDDLLAPYATEIGKRSLMRCAAGLDTNHTTEITPLLPRVSAPTLVIWGEADVLLPAKYGRRLAWDIPRAEFRPVPRAAHFVMWDAPGAVVERLRAFLGAG